MDVTQKIKVRLLGFRCLFLRGGEECRLSVKADGDASCLDVVLVSNGLKDKEGARDSCKFAALCTLSITRTGDCIDRDDAGGVVMSTKYGA